ncbi:hypothetical protein GHK59_35500 [Sinorhizobium meliloti]|nr:hypothetical protein [Sinorhizobium meliloti]
MAIPHVAQGHSAAVDPLPTAAAFSRRAQEALSSRDPLSRPPPKATWLSSDQCRRQSRLTALRGGLANTQRQWKRSTGAFDDSSDHVSVQLSALRGLSRRVFRKADGQNKKREQTVAIFDLLDNNSFAPVGHDGGPYRLGLALADRRLVISVTTEDGAPILCHRLSLTSFRRLLKDYSLVCDSYSDAVAGSVPQRLEAIDTGRRAIHNEASELLRERLRSRIDIDLETARRLFTLLHILMDRDAPYRGIEREPEAERTEHERPADDQSGH